jgi:hypothetical protein
MAIIIEEEKKQSVGWAAIGWLFVAVIVLVAAYYLFLAQPEVASVPPPSNLSALAPLSQITVTPQDVISLESFKALVSSTLSVASSGPAGVGRANPFISP